MCKREILLLRNDKVLLQGQSQNGHNVIDHKYGNLPENPGGFFIPGIKKLTPVLSGNEWYTLDLKQ